MGVGKYFFKQDDRFSKPDAIARFRLLTSKASADPLSAVLADLYTLSCNERLNEVAYQASIAGLTYELETMPRGVMISFAGYNDKMPEYISFIGNKLKGVDEILPDYAEFNRHKDIMKRSLAAFDTEMPVKLASYYSSLLLEPRRFQYSNKNLRKALEEATLPKLRTFAKHLWSSGKGEALIQGNFYENEARSLIQTIDNAFKFTTIPDREIPPKIKALTIPVVRGGALNRIAASVLNPKESNSASQLIFHCTAKNDKSHLLMNLLNIVVGDPFYDELRTKQQLGYIVSSDIDAVGETRTLSLYAQSSVAPAEILTTKILNFVNNIRSNLLMPLTEEQFSNLGRSLVDGLIEPDTNLGDEFERNWMEIAKETYRFDRIQNLVHTAQSLRKNDLMQFWDAHFDPQSDSGQRVIVSEVVPHIGPAKSKIPPRTTGYKRGAATRNLTIQGVRLGVNDIESYRQDREAYVGFKW